MYITYKTTNKITGEFYIGSHKQEDNIVDDGYLGSGKKIRDGIIKYGKEAFIRETLGIFDTRKESVDYEHKLIKQYRKNELCCNLSTGGASFDYINDNLKFDRVSFGAKANHDWAKQQKLKRIEEYNMNPNLCKCCGKPIPYEQRYNQFCCHSCSASFNNPTRTIPHKKHLQICQGCGKVFDNTPYRKEKRFCTFECWKHFIQTNPNSKMNLLKNHSKEVFEMKKSGLTYREIGQKFNVSANCIKDFFKNHKMEDYSSGLRGQS